LSEEAAGTVHRLDALPIIAAVKQVAFVSASTREMRAKKKLLYLT